MIIWEKDELIYQIKSLARSYGVNLSKATPMPIEHYEYLLDHLGMAPKRCNRQYFDVLSSDEQEAVAWMLATSLKKAKALPDGSFVDIGYGMYGWLPAVLLGRFTRQRVLRPV